MPERWRDATIALATAGITMLSIGAATESGAREPDVVAYLLGAFGGSVLIFWRRWPVAVLLATIGVHYGYHCANYPGGPPLLAVWVALFAVAASGRSNIALILGVVNSAGGFGWRMVMEGDNPVELSMLLEPALMFASVALGDAVHARRRWTAEAKARVRQAEHEAEMEAQRRVDAERLRIAQELHDVLAHTLAVVNVQAGVASELLDDDPTAARNALQEMRRASRDAMSELRATVGILRERGPAPLAPAPGIDDLARVIEGARQAGLTVETRIEGDAAPVPAAVDLAAFRIVQEALTNVVRHAAARTAQIVVGYGEDGITVAVADDGLGTNGGGEGFGMRGMRERVEALGGRFEAGSGGEGGFEVRAWLPVQRA